MNVTHLLSPADILWKTLEAYGFDAASVFSKVGISLKMIRKPGLRIPHAKAEKLWRHVAGRIEDPCFGLRAAQYWHPSHFNALGYAWLASPTLREAFQRASRYARIVGCDRETRIEEKPAEIILTLSNSLQFPPLMDLSMAIFMSACRANYGPDLNPLGVTFIHATLHCDDQYDSFFNAPITFNAKTDSLRFSTDVANRHLPTGNPYLAELHDQYIISYLETIKRNDFVSRVKNAIIERLNSGKVSDADVAARLNMSGRTLQRKLNHQDTNFRAILSAVRQDLARHYIHDSDTSLMEIAFLLGYSEYTSFSRAYKKWTGRSPGQDRRLGSATLTDGL